MDIVETLRGRFHPEWKGRTGFAGLDTMLETALSFIPVPARKKATIEEPRTLSALGVSEVLRRELGKVVVPELRRIRSDINARRAAIEDERASMTKPSIDPTDLSAALRRQEIRSYLRGLDVGERMGMLLTNPNVEMLSAAMEGPPALSGLTIEARERVEGSYVQATHGKAIRALEDRGEALTVVDVAVQFAIKEIRANVGLPTAEFESWFENGDRDEKRRAA